jgi:hypothetical protein
MLLDMFTDATRWRALRAGYLEAARKCREALTTDKECCYTGLDGVQRTFVLEARCQPGDPEVKAAVRYWVQRARRAHAIAMGREPVMKNFVFIGQQGAYQGPVYAAGSGLV